jgi:hypothetical protein|uniref:Secretin/TonB short N-terminal domain-containing protein n=1 Tax=Mesoaciditoga lauensis TaxID=1495039 RepID=A0A7V3RE99_9BACT
MKKIILTLLIFLTSATIFGLDFSFYNADLRSAINDVSRTYNVQVILADDVVGTVDVFFQASNFEEALQKLLLTTNYTFAKVGNFYLVGGMNSPDKIRTTLYKPSIIFLKNISPKVAYDLLGTLSRYVLYSQTSNLLLVDADEQTKDEISDLISKIDVSNENRVFYYEIHEMTADEYQRFRQIEQVNKSAILTFSGSSFEIFREVMKIKGTFDIFGNVTIETVGEAKVNLTDPQFAMSIKSEKNTVNVSLLSGVNTVQIAMSDQKNHAVAMTQTNGKNFLIFMGFADNMKDDFAFENYESKKYFEFAIYDNQLSGKVCGHLSYGSTELAIVSDIYLYQTPPSTTGFFVGMEGNLIDQMYGKIMIGLQNMSPAVNLAIKDTTSMGFLKLKGELCDTWNLNGLTPLQFVAGVGFDLWNIEVFGGIRGKVQSAEPYIELSLSYEWIRAKLLWDSNDGYTFGGGIIVDW